ncbi:GL17840 [Drosophila persimilis]|uniref:Uncharacterized protein n=2 Tax=pseudoobscura subgroup TaxID=32358 RepID=Q29EL9_DROPS|nr:uncharacterized protein LOC4812018 [Drosophila pseudoobscura]XP_002024954.1 uncharacterized protein LOC6599701 [Drosophila persimilis]XP_017135343.1 uncharacterized protein LOC108151315 [Drosophila miranda]EDW30427.1 GL17840 [Drosophila persimilis]
MFKLFVFLTLCLAFACAAPGLLHSSSVPILTSSYHSLPSVRVIGSPIWTHSHSPSLSLSHSHSHSIVRPLSYGYGHGYGWI